MKVTLILCDAAQVSEGKLYVLGGGWNIAGPGPFPSALGILIEVPWDRSNEPIILRLELREQDGSPVVQQGPLGLQPVTIGARMEVGRPPGVAKGSPLLVPLAINMGSMPLTPGRRYVWEAHIDGQPDDEGWRVGFQVRSS